VGTECWVFFDDYIVYSKSAEEHAASLENYLRRFEEANLQLNVGKCVCSTTDQYLGLVLSVKGVKASPEKVKDVKQYPTPKCVRDVRAFVDLTSFYRRLVPKFAELAKPLTVLTRKDQKFSWGPLQQQALDSMKEKLCTAPVLAYPNFRFPFILTADSSKKAVDTILSNVQRWGGTAYCIHKQADEYRGTKVPGV